MPKINCIIIEDEPLAAGLLSKNLSEHPQLIIKGVFDNGYSGLKAIQDLKPELVFLDIELPKLTGLELLELLDNPPMIIFTTAYNQYAIEAFEKNAVDYLLKPFSKSRLHQAVDKAVYKLKNHDLSQTVYQGLVEAVHDKQDNQLDRIAVKDKSDIYLIATDDIYFLEAQDDYVSIQTKDKAYLKNARLKFYEQNLDPKIFVRVHRSYIVNTNYIKKLESYSKDSFILILNNGLKVNISRSGLQLLRKILYI